MKKRKIKLRKIVNRENLIYEARKYVQNLQQFETIRSFSKNVFADKITLNDADKDQGDLLVEVIDFSKDTKPRNIKSKKLERDT